MLQDRDRRPAIDYGPVRNDPRCGLNAASRSVAQRRIVGGSEAGFGSFPWQAYIRIGKKTVCAPGISSYDMYHFLVFLGPDHVQMTKVFWRLH